MSDIVKYNYDVVVASENQIEQYKAAYKKEYLQPNDAMFIDVTDEFKQQIAASPNKNEIVKRLFFNPDMGLPLGFNYVGYNASRRMHRTKVFYFNPNKIIPTL